MTVGLVSITQCICKNQRNDVQRGRTLNAKRQMLMMGSTDQEIGEMGLDRNAISLRAPSRKFLTYIRHCVPPSPPPRGGGVAPRGVLASCSMPMQVSVNHPYLAPHLAPSAHALSPPTLNARVKPRSYRQHCNELN